MKHFVDIEVLREKDEDLGGGLIKKGNAQAFNVGDVISITEKIDGSNASIEYVDGKLEEVGSIPGWIDEDSVTKENNKEITSTSGIIDLIQQNCYEGKYEMKDGRLVEIEREFYNLVNYENQDITLLEELIVYECPDVESKQFTMQPQKVHLVRSDGVEWMEIVAEDGTKGYARADGFTMLDMDNRDSTEIFDGLAYAG